MRLVNFNISKAYVSCLPRLLVGGARGILNFLVGLGGGE